MRRLTLAWLGAWLLTACQTAPTPDDARDLQAAASARTGGPVPAPAATAAAIGEAATALLRQPLDDDAAVKIALLENRRVRAIYERLGIARTDLVQAGLLRNPVLDADARFLFGGGAELELGLAQPFLDVFWRPLRERAAAHDFAAAQALLTDELVHLVFAVRRVLVDLRAAQQLATVRRDALRAAEAAHQLAYALHAAGNLTDQALANERLGETRARLDLAAAELAVGEAREPVQRLLGLWGAWSDWQVAGELAPQPLAGLDLAHVETRAIRASLALTTHRARLEALAQRLGVTSWRQWFPDGGLGASAIRESDGDWGLGPKLTLELPLLDDGSTRRTREEHALRSGLLEQTQLAVEIRSAARALRERATALAEQARFLREVHLPAREALVHATLQHYNAMQIGAFDALAQRRQQLADQREYVTTLRDAHRARLDLQELLAGSLPASAWLAPGSAEAPDDPSTANGAHR